MQDKIRSYIDGLFSVLPVTDEVNEAKEELYNSMVDRYNDSVAEGMEEQEAYDSVIESIGDIHELFAELEEGKAAPKGANATGKSVGLNIHDMLQTVTEFTGGLVNGLFGNMNSTEGILPELKLVNTRVIPLEGVTSIDVCYISESIQVLPATDGTFTIMEYMNRDESDLYAEVTMRGNSVSVRNGRRQGVWGLRSRVEVYLPAEWNGSLSLSTVGGSVQSDEEWKLASLRAKTISGEVAFKGVDAGMIRMSSTSGTVKLGKGVGMMELHSVSGSVRVSNAEGGGSFKTTSGSVRVDFDKLAGHVDASTVSGSVRVNLPAEANFEFEGRSVSGNIYTAFDECLTYQRRNRANGFVGEGPYYHLKVATTSGGIHVND